MLHAMIRDGITLVRSLEFTAQWDGIIRIGPVRPLAVQDFDLARRGGLGEWCQVVEGLHLGLSDFIHRAVVHRREEAIRGWRNWFREDPLLHPYKCEGSGDVVGVLTLLVGGVAQAFHDDRVVELRVQLGVEEVEGKDREEQVEVEREKRVREGAP